MPICPQCSTGFDDETHCPKCGAPSPMEVWPRPGAGSDLHKPDYGSFSLFCLRLTQIVAFVSILWSIAMFVFHLFQWDNFVIFFASLVGIPLSIGGFLIVGIAIRFAEEKNRTR